MPVVTSKDGTEIAYSRVGDGPALIIVCGATQFRAFDPSDLVFIGPADVDEYQMLPGIQPLFHFYGRYLKREGFRHHSILSAGALCATVHSSPTLREKEHAHRVLPR